jgi:hypothetical protein
MSNYKIEESVKYKQCTRCFEWFECTADNFYVNKTNKTDRLMPYCKKCCYRKALDWQYRIVAKRDSTPERKEIKRKAA